MAPQLAHAATQPAWDTTSDGNVYLMRNGPAAEIYVISQGGVVVRRFAVDPGDSVFSSREMHAAVNRLAVVFTDSSAKRELMKVVDLHGNPVAEYTGILRNGVSGPFPPFACYSLPGDKFTFLTTSKDNKLLIEIAEPR